MNPRELPKCIRLTFSHTADPGTPLPLDKDAAAKLGHIPSLLRAFADCYGSKLENPVLWGGEVHLPIATEKELFDVADSMVKDIKLCAKELSTNANRRPPLPLAEAVTHLHCIDLLRALARAHSKSKLTASLHTKRKVFELPHLPLSCFTEPDTSNEDVRYLRAKVIGICVPKADANLVLLGDLTFLELPVVDYAHDLDDLIDRVIRCSTLFVGCAKLVEKNTYRALPRGELQAQLPLQGS